MDGEQILIRTLSATRRPDKFGNLWQYHPRSDAHSKVACWCILFDLMQQCTLLRQHVEAGQVAFGINHEMHDYQTARTKNLDLVLCRPRSPIAPPAATLDGLVKRYAISLTAAERARLAGLPGISGAPVGSVLVALEAKACMTEHSKARPRLYDELSSSAQTVHGDTNQAMACGFVMINTSSTFVSPDRNRHPLKRRNPTVTHHRQPHAARVAVEKVGELRRRSEALGGGFDALGITLVEMANDLSTVRLTGADDEYGLSGILRYDAMVHRMAHIYSTRFGTL